MRRFFARIELTRQHGTEDLQRDAAVRKGRPRIVLEDHGKRFLVHRNVDAQAAETDAARQRKQVAKGDAPFSRVRGPLIKRVGDALIEPKYAVALRHES